MVLIFTLSAVMLHPRMRVIFKAPVPHIHDTIGKLMIPWGLTYLIFLPDIYLSINGVAWRDHAYVVVSLVSIVILLSASSWSFMAFLQQRVKQSVLQPVILAGPVLITLWYIFSPAEWMLTAFAHICLTEMVFLVGFYIKQYISFVRGVKANYSNVNDKMFKGLWIQQVGAMCTLVTFLLAMAYDMMLWNVINILSNLVSLCVFVYTSENLMPLPEEPVAAVADNVHDEKFLADIARALHDHCEVPLLFVNPELSLQDLSLALGTNRTYLSKWFAMNNTTFYNYINGLRTEYAGRLLKETDKPVTQVQTEAGFVSKTTFRKYFVGQYGCTPSDFRKG